MLSTPESVRRTCFFRQCTVQDMMWIIQNTVEKFVISAVIYENMKNYDTPTTKLYNRTVPPTLYQQILYQCNRALCATPCCLALRQLSKTKHTTYTGQCI